MDADTPLIRLRGIAFAYEPEREVLRDADLDVFREDKVGLTGPNGSGKSTLLQLLVGLVYPSAGEVEMFGEARRTERDFAEVRRRVGIVFQDPDDQLFCPTVAEDVAFGPLNLGRAHTEAERAADAALERVGLTGFGDRVAYRLSYGEKRLVALATVLAMDPEVLLLDEPAAGLDEAHTERLTEIVKSLPQAMVIVSHGRGFLDQVATRYVRLADGSVHDPG